jgi:hypothetical protein
VHDAFDASKNVLYLNVGRSRGSATAHLVHHGCPRIPKEGLSRLSVRKKFRTQTGSAVVSCVSGSVGMAARRNLSCWGGGPRDRQTKIFESLNFSRLAGFSFGLGESRDKHRRIDKHDKAALTDPLWLTPWFSVANVLFNPRTLVCVVEKSWGGLWHPCQRRWSARHRRSWMNFSVGRVSQCIITTILPFAKVCAFVLLSDVQSAAKSFPDKSMSAVQWLSLSESHQYVQVRHPTPFPHATLHFQVVIRLAGGTWNGVVKTNAWTCRTWSPASRKGSPFRSSMSR